MIKIGICDDEKIVLSQRLFGVRCDENKVDPKFIYFYMTSEMFQWVCV